MERIELGEVQAKFAELLWQNVPIASGALVKICEKELGWKKPTTYTVLRKLCEKGLFENVGGVVSAKLSREEYCLKKSEELVEDSYSGSLPAFLAAFLSRKKLSRKEAEEIEAMIGAYQKEVR